jgi:hypothetical protein
VTPAGIPPDQDPWNKWKTGPDPLERVLVPGIVLGLMTVAVTAMFGNHPNLALPFALGATILAFVWWGKE